MGPSDHVTPADMHRTTAIIDARVMPQSHEEIVGHEMVFGSCDVFVNLELRLP